VDTSVSDVVAVRRRKLEQLRARGLEPYPNDFVPTATSAAVRDRFGALTREQLDGADERVRIAGRVVGLRDFGKASFLHLLDRAGRIQVYVKRDAVGEADFEAFRLAEVGDFLGVEGRPFRTKTDELTIEAATVRVLTKSLLPLPEKWHGLTDIEARYRQRYLDLVANEHAREVFVTRARLVGAIRSFFVARDYLEVETPMMQAIAGGAAARPFVTHHNALDMDLFLRIAPELYLKRLLVGGFERVFEMNRVFRNEGISTRHNPEFTMLEFYQAYATADDLIRMTEELLVTLADEVAGSRRLPWGEETIDLEPPFRRICMPEYVAERAGVPLEDVLRLDLDTLKRAAATAGFEGAGGYEARHGEGAAGYLLTDLFEAMAEPEMRQPTFVHQYPVAVSPLARRNRERPEFVDRFELFIASREIANGFSELNDPVDQRGRLEQQARSRAAGDVEAHEWDEDFLRALEHGMPPAAGEGIGIDRLVMLFTNESSIRDVILFPLLRPESR
jgi:lysyl-tRNA synthetase class 2